MIITFNGTLAEFQVVIAIIRGEDPDTIAAITEKLSEARHILEAAEAENVSPVHPSAT